MRKPEQQLWDALRQFSTRNLLLMRVENMVGDGHPDVEALAAGLYTPIELKSVPAPAREGTPVLGRRGLSVAQRNWHHRWAQAGGRSLIVVRYGQDVAAIDGRRADLVNDMDKRDLWRAGLTWPERRLEDVARLLTETGWRT